MAGVNKLSKVKTCLKKSATALLNGFLLIVVSVSACAKEPDAEFSIDNIQVPDGFRISVVADVPNARSLVLGDDGTLFVSSRRIGKLYALRGVLAEIPEVLEIASGLRYPNGIAYHDGDLYIAESERILKLGNIEAQLDAPGEPEIVVPKLLAGKQHSWKYLAIGPDNKLYTGIGVPCNVCDEPDYGVIQRMNLDGSELEVIARGIRNTLGFDWHPVTGDLWFTDNNRDMMGDDLPPDELNHLGAVGEHFGFPFCHGTDIREPEDELAALGTCADSKPPAQELGPHVAALGLAFYDGEQFPEKYRNQVFIAEHGSWNRSKKIGYRVSLVTLDGNTGVDYRPFAEGWLQGQATTGRPVDVIVAEDGSLLISDDYAGKVYRIEYVGAALAAN
jgi:glucose/arabinose dehydrogenase